MLIENIFYTLQDILIQIKKKFLVEDIVFSVPNILQENVSLFSLCYHICIYTVQCILINSHYLVVMYDNQLSVWQNFQNNYELFSDSV